MGHTFCRLWFHLVWSTKDREPLLTQEIRPQLYFHIKQKAQAQGCYLDAVNGVADHIHCLISIPPKCCVSECVNKLKGESSHWINFHKLTQSHFAWQTGFGAFSVSESHVERVRRYILNQEYHHHGRSYAEEIDAFSRLYKIHTSSSR